MEPSDDEEVLVSRVEAFVESLLAMRAIERAIAEDGLTPRRLAAWQDARAAMRSAEARLTGTMMGAARRELSERLVAR